MDGARLLTPDKVDLARVHDSFLAAMAEFAAENRGDLITDHWIARWAPDWADPEVFAGAAAAIAADALPATPRPEGHVPCTSAWFVDGAAYLGRLSVRHVLTERLREVGGHIGYDVRPSARRQGHATRMLGQGLGLAAGLGLDRVLLTCDEGNLASVRVIEANGGEFEDVRQGKRRYWLATAS